MPGPNYIDLLAEQHGHDWPAIREARIQTSDKRKELEQLFSARTSPDTSLVVFGSVARQEATLDSDLDWILLIDGQSVPEHKEQEREAERTLAEAGFIEPGKSGVFGKMVGSHALVHNIGGEDDLNSNTTRRVLLLLESVPIGDDQAYFRVRRQILRRYLEDDRGLINAASHTRIPRFLLNDLTRYWRTVTVDFVYKQRADNDKKWALRNAKLRMSRKLIFAAGLLHCFLCDLDPAANDVRQALRSAKNISPLVEYLEKQLSLTPLDLVAKVCLDQKISSDTVRSIFDNYDSFLAVLNDSEKRSELERTQVDEDLRQSGSWQEVRDLSRPFHEGLVKLFLEENTDLTQLTMEYGIF